MPVVNYVPKYPECRVPASFPTKQNINNGITKEFAEVRETLLHHFYPNSTKRFIEKE